MPMCVSKREPLNKEKDYSTEKTKIEFLSYKGGREGKGNYFFPNPICVVGLSDSDRVVLPYKGLFCWCHLHWLKWYGRPCWNRLQFFFKYVYYLYYSFILIIFLLIFITMIQVHLSNCNIISIECFLPLNARNWDLTLSYLKIFFQISWYNILGVWQVWVALKLFTRDWIENKATRSGLQSPNRF